MSTQRTANVIGLGLIGGSIALALGDRGWRVFGEDDDESVQADALSRGVIEATGLDPSAQITFVAVPASVIVPTVERALAATTGAVTDVGSVKAAVVRRIENPRFVGGHPMAGSELDGLDGADANLFDGAVWVLTPTEHTDDAALTSVSHTIRLLGAEAVAIAPEQHDRLVAVVSHVPHLTAASLMHLAAERSVEHSALLRLAAGGFRDMTRIASGSPAIWIDICSENKDAIVEVLDAMIDQLGTVRGMVADGDSERLRRSLTAAREARQNLPGRALDPTDFAEVRIPIPDRSGAAAEVFTLAAELGVNIASFEVVHNPEGDRGVAVVLIDLASSDVFRGGLLARGFRPTISALT